MKRTLLKTLALSAATVIFSSCTVVPNTSTADLYQAPKNTRDWNDYVSIPTGLIESTEVTASDCLEKITKSVCLVDPTEDMNKTRTCLPQSINYQEKVTQVYETLPLLFQKMFCSLRVIWIEKELTSIAYAGQGVDSTGRKVNVMGVRASVFDENIPLENMLSWKEQKLFGIEQPAYQTDPAGPKFHLSGPKLNNSGLYYALIHELGHLFDFNNQVNDFETLSTEWSRLSWGNGGNILPTSALAIFNKLICFYGCEKHLSLDQRADFYTRLEQSNFLTSYAATHTMEDFAEATAFYFFKKHFQQEVSIQVPTLNQAIPLSKKMELPVYKSKLDFVEKFYSGNPSVGDTDL